MDMNRVWMVERLLRFEALCQDWLNTVSDSGEERSAEGEMNREWPTVLRILDAVDPELGDSARSEDLHSGVRSVMGMIQQGIGATRDWEEVVANLAPESPVLLADQFHEHVWSAAAPLWGTGQYRVAVQQAATALSAHIRQRSGSHLSDRALVQSVFSPSDPGPTQPRLHGAKTGGTNETWKSRQDGLHLIAQGAFAGIRNVAAHTDDEWTEQIALEQLAVLSVLARWADETVLTQIAPVSDQSAAPPSAASFGSTG
jgi:hypothetical protein